jgi:hypothetical protein
LTQYTHSIQDIWTDEGDLLAYITLSGITLDQPFIGYVTQKQHLLNF